MQRIALPLLGLDMHLAAGHKYRVEHDRGGGHVAFVDLDRLAVAALELALEFRDDYGMRAGLDERILDALKLVDVDAIRRQDGDLPARDGVGFCVVFDADVDRRFFDLLASKFFGRLDADALGRAHGEVVVDMVEYVVDHAVADLFALNLTE